MLPVAASVRLAVGNMESNKMRQLKHGKNSHIANRNLVYCIPYTESPSGPLTGFNAVMRYASSGCSKTTPIRHS